MSTPDRERPYSVSQTQANPNGATFTDIERDGGNLRTENETEEKFDYIPAAVTAILSSIYFLIVLCIMLVIPILELAIGAAYRDQCPINPNIPIYLIVTGACGIGTIVLTMLIAVSLICCLKQHAGSGPVAIGCIIAIILLIIILMSAFLFVWFIVGNVWIFGAKSTVDLDNVSSTNYCHRTLYQFAFGILIVSYIMMGVSCCSSCFRMCCQMALSKKK